MSAETAGRLSVKVCLNLGLIIGVAPVKQAWQGSDGRLMSMRAAFLPSNPCQACFLFRFFLFPYDFSKSPLAPKIEMLMEDLYANKAADMEEFYHLPPDIARPDTIQPDKRGS